MRTFLVFCFSILVLIIAMPPATAQATTAFTYQGQLQKDGQPFTGTIASTDITFELFDGPDPGASNPVAGPMHPDNDVQVTDGLFQVELDFGQGAFDGSERYLEIEVSGTTLSPRQKINSVPTAQHALNGPFWSTKGNAAASGDILGTTNSEPLRMVVNHNSVMRIFDATEPDGTHAPNLIAGSLHNAFDRSIAGATNGGGGGNPSSTSCGPSGSDPCVNVVAANFATVTGGFGNYATGFSSTAMGYGTTASGIASTAMGRFTIADVRSTAMGNRTYAQGSSTAMGNSTTASGIASTAMGGGTIASGFLSTAMGSQTIAAGDYSTAMGRNAEALHNGTYVWGDSKVGSFQSTGPNQFLVRASGGVGINTNDPSDMLHVQGASPSDIFDGQVHIEGDETTGDAETGGALVFEGHDGETPRVWGAIQGVKENSTVGNTDSVMRFYTRQNGSSPQERFRIDSDGNTFNSDGTWSTLSDRRLKRDIGQIERPLDRLLSLRGVGFHYRDNEQVLAADGPRMGFIAQEVESVFPEWVGESADGYKYVAPAGFRALVVEALRQFRTESERNDNQVRERLVRELSVQEARIRQLEGRLAEVQSTQRSRIEELEHQLAELSRLVLGRADDSSVAAAQASH